jgi:hypothetical protein
VSGGRGGMGESAVNRSHPARIRNNGIAIKRCVFRFIEHSSNRDLFRPGTLLTRLGQNVPSG